MNKYSMLAVVAAAMLAGCQMITVTDAQRARIEELAAQGITWDKNPPEGFKPVVKQTPAQYWGLLPGAGQMFVSHKVTESKRAGLYSRDELVKMHKKGVLMVCVGWWPGAFLVTVPGGITGAIGDTHRINNIAMLHYIDSKAAAPKK